jgi:hypothetical protein
VAFSRGGSFQNVRAVVEQEEGMQGVFEGLEGIAHGVYTLNIVDRSLLTGLGATAAVESERQALPMMVEPVCVTAGAGQELGDEFQEGAASSFAGQAVGQSALQDYEEQAHPEADPPASGLFENLGSEERPPSMEHLGQNGAASGSSSTPAAVECARCGRWGHVAENCTSYRQPPLRHADATSRGAGPHMRQVDTDHILATTVRGQASGMQNNCLIDSLRQLLDPTASVRKIRRALQLEFRSGATRVTAKNYLQFDFHATAILRQMGFDPSHFTLTCLDLAHRGHGDVIGHGARQLYLARQNQNHFVPLFRRGGVRNNGSRISAGFV